MTQKEMSELMQIPFRTIQQWEGSQRKPPEYVKRFVLKELKEIELAKCH